MAIKPYNRTALSTFFRDFLLAENMSKATVQNYMSDFQYFIGWLSLNPEYKDLGKGLNLSLIAHNLVGISSQYKTYLANSNRPHSTIRRKLYTLKKIAQACHEIGELSELDYKTITTLAQEESSTLSINSLITQFRADVSEREYEQHSKALNELKNYS